MIRYLILEKFDVFYSARYMSELLQNMGYSFQSKSDFRCR